MCALAVLKKIDEGDAYLHHHSHPYPPEEGQVGG